MAWLVEFNFGAGFVDYTTSIVQGSLHRRMDLHNELGPTANSCIMDVVGTSALVASLMQGAADIPVQVTKDGTRWFTGYAQRIQEVGVTHRIGDIRLTVYDGAILLKKKFAANYSATASTVSVVVEAILTAAGITHSLGTIAKTIDAACFVKGEDTYWDAVKDILSDFGYVLYFDAGGTARVHYLYPVTVTPTVTSPLELPETSWGS